jgi:outer membrane protein
MKLVLAALMMMGSFAQAAEMKLGYIDMNKALQETSAGKKAKAELEKEFKAKRDELSKKQTDLKKMGEDFEKKRGVLSDEVRQKKQAELQQEMMKWQEAAGQAQMTMQAKEQEALKPIFEKMQKAIERVAKEQGYTMILEKSQSVVYGTPENDVTPQVIKAFDTMK